jgi:hypothetical protein
MVDLRWDGSDFRNEQDSSGSTADKISHSGKLQQGYQHGSLTRGLVAYYPMEKGEGEVLHDGSLNSLAQINGASWTTGEPYSNTLSFNGSSDEVVSNTQGMKSIADSTFTIIAWVYPTAFDGRQDIINTHSGSGGFNLEIEGPSATDGVLDVIIQYSDGTNSHVKSNSAINLNEWTMVAFTLDDNNQPEFFLNGSSDGAGAGKSTIESKPDDIADTSYIGSSGGATYFTGKIGEIRAYDRVLSQPAIQTLYNISQPSGTQVTEKQVPGQNQDGISRYKLNGDVSDSWSSNNGNFKGSTPKYKPGVYGQAGDFNGADNNIAFSNSPIPATDKITVSLWTKGGSSQPQQDSTMEAQDASGNRVLNIHLPWGNETVYWDFGDDPYDRTTVDLTGFNWQTWNHWTFVVDATKPYMAIHRNGKIIKKDNSVGKELTAKPSQTKIGSYIENTEYYDGRIDDVRIYNTALTPQQVEKLYQKGAYRIPRESTLQ